MFGSELRHSKFCIVHENIVKTSDVKTHITLAPVTDRYLWKVEVWNAKVLEFAAVQK